jgi:HSP20 family protein
VFEESDHILVVAEMPGIGPDDLRIEVKDDILTLSAEKGTTRYRKEILLPRAVQLDKTTISCNNGIVEVKCLK